MGGQGVIGERSGEVKLGQVRWFGSKGCVTLRRVATIKN